MYVDIHDSINHSVAPKRKQPKAHSRHTEVVCPDHGMDTPRQQALLHTYHTKHQRVALREEPGAKTTRCGGSVTCETFRRSTSLDTGKTAGGSLGLGAGGAGQGNDC